MTLALVARLGWLPRAAGFALLGVLVAASAPSCNDGSDLLRAKVIENRSERVGGPVSMADVGDFLLENDQIRVAILRAVDSPGPGPYGGSIVDIDRRRPMIGTQGENGIDRFAEAFPLANLLVPEPNSTEVFVLADGSDGEEAAIRVQGWGGFFLEALGVLRTQQPLLEVFFPNLLTELYFTTDYILHPGDRHVLMRTTLRLGDATTPGCPEPSSCPNECPFGRATDPQSGCLSCDCSDALPLHNYAQPDPVLRGLLGDPVGEADSTLRAGIVAGDFVFFGNQTDVFAAGPGFDEEWAVQTAFNAGRNTFQEPLSYDVVAAAGGDVSYAYFTVPRPGEASTRVNVPLITSAATAFLSAYGNCLYDAADDASCDRHRTFTYERYIAVGDGDVASVMEEAYRVRGTPTGELRGHVLWAETNEPVPNAQVLVFADPAPGTVWRSVDELVAANLIARGDFGLINAIDADLGLDEIEDGDFRGVLPEGPYVMVAKTRDGAAVGVPQAVGIRNGKTTLAVAALTAPGTVSYRVTDAGGFAIPAKIALVSLDAAGQPLQGDGLRRPYLGHGRLGNGIKELGLTASGEGELAVEPGRYRVIVSRGPEYAIHREDVTVASGRVTRVDAVLAREVDTAGWMSIDTHLHSTMSFDSGLPIDERVTSAAAEGVELAISTDHDVITDYRPHIKDLMLEHEIATALGDEISTLEQGHFIAFPLRYDATEVPMHGGLDWSCMNVAGVIDWMRANADGIEPLTIVAHPRDGFLGYLSQLGVDQFTMNRELSLFEQNNPSFRTATCDFDAMEVFNAKRFELIRTPTVAEVVDWNHCLDSINAAQNLAELGAACPEYSPGLPALTCTEAGAYPGCCTETEPYASCQDRRRSALAWRALKQILIRTPEEQLASWTFAGNSKDSQALCDSTAIAAGPVPVEQRDQPCTFRVGHVDDLFRLLERGMFKPQLGGSDSHGASREPGCTRSYYRSSTDSPAAVDVGEAVESLRGGHSFATYGPFVAAKVRDRSFGDLVAAAPGEQLDLDLKVRTASWFGVDRVEIYLNGLLERVIEPGVPTSELEDVKGRIPLVTPARDSWIVIIAMGLEDRNLMSPISLDWPWGELELSRIASDAFSRVPMVSSIFPPPPAVANWGPVPAFAVTNPIFIDTNGNGRYDPPLPPPEFCSRPCDAASADPLACPSGQECLSIEGQCGFNISGRCNRRPPNPLRDH